nr:MAG TPA: hypothetical protein [Caudoviricetes sp.]
MIKVPCIQKLYYGNTHISHSATNSYYETIYNNL